MMMIIFIVDDIILDGFIKAVDIYLMLMRFDDEQV